MSKLSQFIGGGGSGDLATTVISASAVVEPNTKVGIDTSLGSVTATMPPDPEPGDIVTFFDASLTWNTNFAYVDRNGHIVEGYDGFFDTLGLSSKGGITSFLYVSETVGWKDISFYTTGLNPVWSGELYVGDVQVTDRAMFGTPSLLQTFSASDTYTIPDSGNYLLLAVGGGGGASTSGPQQEGGDSSVETTAGFSFTASGGLGSPSSTFSLASSPRKLASINRLALGMSVGNLRLKHVSGHIAAGGSTGILSDASLFGISELGSGGAVVGTSTVRLGGGGAVGSSILVSFEAGEVLTVTVGGGGGTTSGSSYARGGAGRVRIYKVE